MSTKSNTAHDLDDAAQGPQQYLTVSQAAMVLSVHPSTIRRWIDQGRLPAYRLGLKRIGVKAVDLTGMVVPRSVTGELERRGNKEEHITVHPLSERERRQLLAAIEAARRHQTELLAQRGGESFPDSTELIREAREGRTRDVIQALEE